MSAVENETGSSPYSTGGGGVRLEHEVAASGLAGLLLAQPVDGLGDELTPTRVALQQEAHSPVDDVIVHGAGAGGEREIRLACRRRPTLGKSSKDSVKLFADFVQVVLDESQRLESGALRLGLVVEGPFGPAIELATLADVARRQPTRDEFEAAIAAPGAYNTRVRTRLEKVDELAGKALEMLKRTGEPRSICWRLLQALYVIQVQYEGDAAPGRTALVARLQVLTGDTARAEQLRLRLVEIASQGAIRAGVFTRAELRRELRSFGLLNAAPDFIDVRAQVDLLEKDLRLRTHRYVPTPGSDSGFTLDRADVRDDLVGRIVSAAAGGGVVVHGEPDVGKSAVALDAIDSIRAAGGVALVMSLRDLPDAAVSLKGELGLSPMELFAAAPSAPVSALLLDGAEAVQERDPGAARALLDAAASAGLTTVLVARDDAMGAVRQLVKSPGLGAFEEVVIASLTDTEVQVLVGAVPQLKHFAADPRANWLLRRLGLVELLLQSTGCEEMPESLSSEADIFATVWHSLVRQDERMTTGVTPDERDSALVQVARALLNGLPSNLSSGALTSLRSDGILLSRSRSTAWKPGDRFASDVLRDFATASLLLREGLTVLAQSSAPRWAIRATRLYAQAVLSEAAREAPEALASRWMELRDAFDALARRHGARWSELLWDATLTAGWADRVLADLTPQLESDGSLLNEAIRCVEQRFSTAGACDPIVGAPLVAWITRRGLLRGARYYHESSPANVVSLWLRGVARAELGGQDVAPYRALRAGVREELLRVDPIGRYHGWLECLGLLAADASEASRSALRELAKESPHLLAPLVESLDAAVTLARHDAALLSELTEAYYIEEPQEVTWYSAAQDEGIRHHQGGGWGTPLAAWYRGPFLPLLRADPRRGLQVVNRMLDRGARDRVAILESLDQRARGGTPGASGDQGLELDVIGLGRRFYAGDSHAWMWYRGSGVGPYPCMSALFALEMLLEESVRAGGHPGTIARWVLKDATTLASVGLTYGFLVRHLDHVTNELDGFLTVPAIWELEFSRALSEGKLHVQGPDPADLPGKERRRWTPREVAAQLVIRAAQRDDQASLERLAGVGRALVDAAGGPDAPPQVNLWASHLDWESYAVQDQGHQQIVEVRPPAKALKALAPAHRQSSHANAMYALMNRYRLRDVTPYRMALASLPDLDQLSSDYRTARVLELELEQEQNEIDLRQVALSGVAASILEAAYQGLAPPDGSLPWAVRILVDSSTRSIDAGYGSEYSVFPDGADRKAALALPLALHVGARYNTVDSASSELGPALKQLEQALVAAATSPAIEVRWRAAEGLGAVFDLACARWPDGRCVHEVAWSAIQAGARAVGISPKWEGGRRPLEPLSGDLADALSQRSAQDLMLTHLMPPTTCVLIAARSESCLAARAAALQPALLEAYTTVACRWADENYRWGAEEHAALASAVVGGGSSGAARLITILASTMEPSPRALGEFLHALAMVATFEASTVSMLAEIWPHLMQLGLSVVAKDDRGGERFAREVLLRNLVPRPVITANLADADAVLRNAEADWLGLESVSVGIAQWLGAARGYDGCVDALVGFLRTQNRSHQVDPGLGWLRSLVVKEDGSAYSSGLLLPGWLRELRDSGALAGGAWMDYRVIVDALAVSGYRGGRELQKRDE